MQTRKIDPWLAWKRLCEDLNLDVAAMQIGFQEILSGRHKVTQSFLDGAYIFLTANFRAL